MLSRNQIGIYKLKEWINIDRLTKFLGKNIDKKVI
jgi:hypothetical protein